MRRCPRCEKRMALGIRWSNSKKRFRIIFKCSNCYIWMYPKDFY